MSQTYTIPAATLPAGAITELLQAATNPTQMNKEDAFTAALALTSYGSQFVFGQPSGVQLPAAVSEPWKELKAHLQPLTGVDPAKMQGLNINWASILGIVFQLLPLIFKPATP